MIPLLALASLLAGATYFGLPGSDGDDDQDQSDDTPPPPTDDGTAAGDLLDAALGYAPLPEAAPEADQGDPVPDEVTGWNAAAGQAGPLPDPAELVEAVADTGTELYGTVRTLTGTDAADTLRAGFSDTLEGQDGDDTLLGYRGDDHLIGGAGNDLLRAGGGDNLLEGGEGSDMLVGVETHADAATGLDWMLTPADGPSHDVLDGGDGDDVLRMGHGDTGIGGEGSDVFEVQADPAASPDEVPVIEDFDPEHDRLVLAVPFTDAQIIAAWPNAPEHDAEVTVQDFEDGTGATIFVSGEAVAHITGAQGLDPDAIHLSGAELIGPDLAQLDAAGDHATLWHGMPAWAAGRG